MTIYIIIGAVVVLALAGGYFWYTNKKIANIMHRDNSPSMKNYEWLATESADALYPMEILEGEFELPDGTLVGVPTNGIASNGWGERGAIAVIGDREKMIPKKFSITWFSYTENKFYSGAFDFPTAKVEQLFTSDQIDPIYQQKIEFRYIIVGVAPGGVVSLWISDGGVCYEIGFFKANETELGESLLGVDELGLTRGEYIEETLKDRLNPQQLEFLKSHAIPIGQWDRYREQFLWTFDTVGIRNVKSYWAKFLNGENRPYSAKDANNNQDPNRPLPASIQVVWESDSGKPRIATARFDADEIYTVYNNLSKDTPGETIHMDLEIDEFTPTLRVFVKKGKTSIELHKSTLIPGR